MVTGKILTDCDRTYLDNGNIVTILFSISVFLELVLLFIALPGAGLALIFY